MTTLDDLRRNATPLPPRPNDKAQGEPLEGQKPPQEPEVSVLQTKVAPNVGVPAWEPLKDRTDILNEALRLTTSDRNSTYGPPLPNLTLSTKLKEAFRTYSTASLHPAEQEAIEMLLTKLSRIGCAQSCHMDNYVDGAAYLALAGEIARLTREDTA